MLFDLSGCSDELVLATIFERAPSMSRADAGVEASSKDPKDPRDCLQCRVVGVLTFGGVSAYAARLRINTPLSDPRQRLFLAVFSAGFAAAAAARAVI